MEVIVVIVRRILSRRAGSSACNVGCIGHYIVDAGVLVPEEVHVSLLVLCHAGIVVAERIIRSSNHSRSGAVLEETARCCRSEGG